MHLLQVSKVKKKFIISINKFMLTLKCRQVVKSPQSWKERHENESETTEQGLKLLWDFRINNWLKNINRKNFDIKIVFFNWLLLKPYS